jgi:hypothetical protein
MDTPRRVSAVRADVLTAAYTRNPERFVRKDGRRSGCGPAADAVLVVGVDAKEAEMTTSTQAWRAGEEAGASAAGFRLDYPDGSLPRHIYRATGGPSGLDVSKLLNQTGHVTLDLGFGNTAAARHGARDAGSPPAQGAPGAARPRRPVSGRVLGIHLAHRLRCSAI